MNAGINIALEALCIVICLLIMFFFLLERRGIREPTLGKNYTSSQENKSAHAGDCMHNFRGSQAISESL